MATATAKRRLSKSIPKKTTPITRKATFVGDKDLAANTAMDKMLGSINPVTRTTLNRRSLIRGGPTVYLKPDSYSASYAVASTRLARFLKMDDVIAHNAFANISDIKGAVSGEVPGVPLRKLEHAAETQIPDEYKSGPIARPDEIKNWLDSKGSEVIQQDGKYYALTAYEYNPIDYRNPRTQKGMSDLQIFDAISGQQDRHGGNVYVDPQTGKVTGIDDDLSFRASRFKVSEAHGKYPGLPPLVDRQTAQNILRAGPDNLHLYLKHQEGDLRDLTPEEIRDAARRLKDVQDYIRTLQTTGGIVDTWDDNTYNAMMNDPDKTYLGRAVTDLQDAVDGKTLAGYPLKVGPPLGQPQQVPPPMPLPLPLPLNFPPLPSLPQWAQGLPRGGPPRLQQPLANPMSPRAVAANQLRTQPAPPPTPTITTTTTTSTRPQFVPPASRRNPAQAAASRLAATRVRADASGEKEKEKVESPRSPVVVDPSESSSEPEDITVSTEDDGPTEAQLVSPSRDAGPTNLETRVSVLEAFLRDLTGAPERTDVDE